MPDESRRLIDRLVDATYRSGERRIAADPCLTGVHARIEQRPEPKRRAKLDQFGRRHPVRGGALMGAIVVGCSLAVLSIPVVLLAAVGMLKATGFVFLEGFVALVCVVVGLWMAIVCGRVWYRGETP